MHTHAAMLAIGLVCPSLLLAQPAERVANLSASGIWRARCADCHGSDGQGVSGKARSLLNDAAMAPEKDRPFYDLLRAAQGPHAGASDLTEKQAWAVVVHLREEQEKEWRRRGGPGVMVKPDGKGVYATAHARYSVETFCDKGLKTPWGIDWQPGKPERALVTEKDGQLSVLEGGKVVGTVEDLPKIVSRGQGGLMEVAYHPQHASNGWVYLAFAAPGKDGGGQMTKVVRGKVVPKESGWTYEAQETVFEARPEHYNGSGLHFGVRIVFQVPPADEAGNAKGRQMMYFCIGERGSGDLAQKLDRPNGKVYRVWDDGEVPASNPFVKGAAGGTGGAGTYTAVWSYGQRNPQGLCFDDGGNLWVTEHGPRGGDELNLIKAGANYGWPEVSFGINYSDQPFATPWAEKARDGTPITMPVYRWLPSIAACGLDSARKGNVNATFPGWAGDLFAGGLAKETVQRVRVRDGKVTEVEEVVQDMGRVRDVGFGPDGLLYVVLNGPDKIVRLVPAR